MIVLESQQNSNRIDWTINYRLSIMKTGVECRQKKKKKKDQQNGNWAVCQTEWEWNNKT